MHETANDDNRRRTTRHDIRDTLFVQTVTSEQVSVDDMKPANTVNASHTGLQVTLDFDLLVDAEIVLWITQGSQRTMVSGRIRWTRENPAGGYLAGIEVDEDAIPEMQRWIDSRTGTTP